MAEDNHHTMSDWDLTVIALHGRGQPSYHVRLRSYSDSTTDVYTAQSIQRHAVKRVNNRRTETVKHWCLTSTILIFSQSIMYFMTFVWNTCTLANLQTLHNTRHYQRIRTQQPLHQYRHVTCVQREMAKIDNSVHQHQMRQWMGRWKCRTGKCGTNDVKFEGTKMQHWKMRDWNAGLENGVRQWVMSSRSASYFTTEQRRRHWQTRYNVKVNVENISCDRNVRSQRTGSTWRDGVAFMPCGHARFCSACAETVTRVRNGCQLVPHGFTSILLRLKRVQSFFYLNHCHNYFWLLLELTWNVTACMKLNHCRNYVLAVFKNACSTSRN